MARLTWQEVSAPDFGSSISGLKNAFDSLDRGFERAGQTINEYDAAQTATQSNAIMAKVLQLGSPEEAAAALASGQMTNGVDPRRINAAAFAAMRGRQNDLMSTATAGMKLREDQIGLSQEEVKNADFQAFNAPEVRSFVNQRTRALQDGNQQEVDRLDNDNPDILNTVNQQMLNASTSAAQGLRQTSQTIRGTETGYQDAQEASEVADAIATEEAAAAIGGQGERGIAEGRDAIIERLTQTHGPDKAVKIFNGLYGKVRGSGSAGSEFDAILGGPDEVGQDFSGGGGGTGAGGKDLADVVLGDGQGKNGGNLYNFNPKKPISQMSMGELYDYQRQVMVPTTKALGVGKDPKTGEILGSSAAGAFQIVSRTLARAAPVVLGNDWKSKPFSLENQSKIAEYLFERVPVGSDLHGVWEGLPVGTKKTKGMSWASVRDQITMKESGGRIGQNAPSVRNPGSSGVPVQSEVERALTISTVANRYKISNSDTVQIARDWDKTWNSSASETEVAAGLVKGQMAGEQISKVRENILYYMKKLKISNPSVVGALMSRAIGTNHDFLGKIDTWMGTNNGLSFNIDENKLKQLADFAKDETAMARVQLAVKDVDKSLQGNAAADGLVAKLDAAYTAGLAKMRAAGQNTADYTARYQAARQRAGAFQKGTAAQASRTGKNYSR